jgi:predicted alpha/beta-fold hydrolase
MRNDDIDREGSDPLVSHLGLKVGSLGSKLVSFTNCCSVRELEKKRLIQKVIFDSLYFFPILAAVIVVAHFAIRLSFQQVSTMIPFEWVSSSLHSLHDIIFGATGNPWIDDLRHVYHDADHLLGLVEFLLVTPLLSSLLFLFTLNRRRSSNRRTKQVVISALLLLFLFAMSLHEEQSWDPSSATHGPGLVDLITGDEPRLQILLDKCPLLRRGPLPPFWLSNRHVQFIPWMLQNLLHTLPGYDIPFQRYEFVVTDCIDKSIPNCVPHESMTDTITLDIFPPLDGNDNSNSSASSSSMPVVLFSPGLRCHSQDLPSNSIIRAIYGKGFRSVVVNRRGHTPNQRLRAPRWNLFGDVDDLEQVYWHVKHNLLEDPNAPVFLHGISSGCAVVVSALAAWDKRATLYPEKPSPTFVAAVSVTPGYDTSKVLQPDRFKWPYNPLMTTLVKDHFLEQNEQILRSFNATAYEAALAAKSLQDVLDASAPFAGYPSPESYYQHTNPINDMHYISTPIYVLNSVDDPCCRIDNLYEKSNQPEHHGKSYADIVDTSQRGIVAVTKTGSHCPFLDGTNPFIKDPLAGGIMLNSWADQSIAEFYAAALDVYNDRRYLWKKWAPSFALRG